jgi:acetyl-CoA acetyltransferase
VGPGVRIGLPSSGESSELRTPALGARRFLGPTAFAEAGITHNDVDHLMIYDAFAHLPIYGLEDLGFVGSRRRCCPG